MSMQNDGFLLINKPTGPTSHDIIYQLRKLTGIKQIGHAGTLDPFAKGLLLVAIGDATKLLRHYVGMDKEYIATLRLGAVSDTYDRTGVISKSQIPNNIKLSKSEIQKVLKSFIGKQKQTPPMYSAKKIGGKKLYELAREGKTVERIASDIEVYDIKLLSPKFQTSKILNNHISISCHVSSGTYIRTLAHDIGKKLGCGAYLEELERTKIGDFELKDATSVIARERTRDRGNLLNATNTVQPNAENIVTNRLPRLPATLSLARRAGRFEYKPPRNDNGANVLTPSNWQQHLIRLKTVLVSGTFDGLHKGHKNYFQQARVFGQRLVCIVGRSTVVERIKGHAPHYSDKERLKMVKECDEIDRVFLGIDDTDEKVFDFVASLGPDVVALGYDQKAYTKNLKAEMKKRGVEVVVKKMKPFEPETYKSSKMAKK